MESSRPGGLVGLPGLVGLNLARVLLVTLLLSSSSSYSSSTTALPTTSDYILSIMIFIPPTRMYCSWIALSRIRLELSHRNYLPSVHLMARFYLKPYPDPLIPTVTLLTLLALDSDSTII